jgi:monoamine oxidase
MKSQYQQALAADLAKQQWDGCFQRNVLLVLEQNYDQAHAYLSSLAFDSSEVPVNRGFSALTQLVLAMFDGYVDEFLQFVVEKHRTSCALSNFPDEHKPDKLYINVVKRDIADLWQNFALNTNAFLLACRVNPTAPQPKDYA